MDCYEGRRVPTTNRVVCLNLFVLKFRVLLYELPLKTQPMNNETFRRKAGIVLNSTRAVSENMLSLFHAIPIILKAPNFTTSKFFTHGENNYFIFRLYAGTRYDKPLVKKTPT